VYSDVTNDFTAVANNGAKTITVSGISFTFNAEQVLYITRKDTNGNVRACNIDQITVSSSVITLPLESNFVTTDTVNVFLVGSKKSYNQVSDTTYVTIANSNTSIPPVELINTTNVAATTTFYPSAYGFQIGKKAKLRMWDYCTGTVTNSIQISYDSAFTTPIEILGQDVTTGTTATSWLDSAGKAIDYEGIDQCYFRVKSITGDATNTVKIVVDITNETLV
jgi:hypothetical protein